MRSPDVARALTGQRWYAGEAVVDVEPIGRVGPAEHALVHVTAGPPYQVFVDESGNDVLTEPEVACEFVDATRSVRPLGAEQSNTSLVFDEELLVKVFRRVVDGPNPDVEVPGALAAERSAPVLIPRFIRQWHGRELAVGTRFLPNAVDGLTVLKGEADPSTCADELGRVLAELHIAVARRLPTAEATPAAWATARSEALDAGLSLAEPNDDTRGWGLLIRVHGDLHLGQVLRDGAHWWVVDFEGEPLRPLEERRRPASPLKDVAGMLRSFAYARVLAEKEASWEQAASDHFVDAYLGTPGVKDLLPDPIEPVLDLHVAEKALYELRYERAYRPHWAWIPEEALSRMREEGCKSEAERSAKRGNR